MLCAMLIIQVALASAWVALFLRDGGPKTPCKWTCRGGIYTADLLDLRLGPLGGVFHAAGVALEHTAGFADELSAADLSLQCCCHVTSPFS